MKNQGTASRTAAARRITAIITAALAIAMTACNTHKQTEAEAAQPKSLVVYYSQTGATKAVAEQLQQALGADIEAIEAIEPYDGTYDETIQRCVAERAEGKLPQIKPLQANLKDYDVVFLGYPVWFGTYAPPVITLVREADFEGVRVVPFCTFGSGGLEATTADLRAALPGAEVADGYGVRNARIAAMPAELERFLIENGYVEGDAEPLPEYGEEQPVTAEDAAVFDAACGDYMFPLGTPTSVAKRTYGDTADYRFTADSTDPQGNPVQTTIYVVAQGGAKPEFTRVVR